MFYPIETSILAGQKVEGCFFFKYNLYIYIKPLYINISNRTPINTPLNVAFTEEISLLPDRKKAMMVKAAVWVFFPSPYRTHLGPMWLPLYASSTSHIN